MMSDAAVNDSRSPERTRPQGATPPVILLGGPNHGLSVARSLGRRGVPIYAVGCCDLLRHSRFVHWVPASETGDTAEGWLAWLLGPGPEVAGGAVVFPCNDEAVELVATHRKSLEAHYLLTPADDAVTLALLDKTSTYELAARIGVPAPRIWSVRSEEDLRRILPEVPYPCALKPRLTHRFRKHFGVKLFRIDDEPQLLERFGQTSRLGLDMLVTELIPGPDEFCSYWTYVDDGGNARFHFTKRKLRQYPVRFGDGTLHLTKWSPEVAELGYRFVLGSGLRGIAVVEFKRDSRDGRLKLIECGVRFSGATEILPRSGIDLAGLVYADITGAPSPAVGGYRDGVRLWSPVLDAHALLGYWRAGEVSGARALGRWAAALASRPHVTWLHWSDPMPVVAAVRERLRGKKTPATAAPSAAPPGSPASADERVAKRLVGSAP